MKQTRHTIGQIIAKLRRADVELGKGKKVRIFGHEGLRLIVGESEGASDHAGYSRHGENRPL